MNATKIKAKIEEFRQQRDAADAAIANLEELLAKPRTGRVWDVSELQKGDVVYTAASTGIIMEATVGKYQNSRIGEVSMGTVYWDAVSAERHILRQQATVALEKAAKEAWARHPGQTSDSYFGVDINGITVELGKFAENLAAFRSVKFPTRCTCTAAFSALNDEQRKAYLGETE